MCASETACFSSFHKKYGTVRFEKLPTFVAFFWHAAIIMHSWSVTLSRINSRWKEYILARHSTQTILFHLLILCIKSKNYMPQAWRKMEQPYSPNLSDSAECVILCTSWLQSPGRFPGEGGHLSEQGSVIRGLTILQKSFWLGQELSMTH